MSPERFQTIDSFHKHLDYTYVHWDEYKVGVGKDMIGTDGVATCLAITIYDSQRKMGVLAHISGFPDAPKEMEPKNVVDTLIKALNIPQNSSLENLEATLSGEGLIRGDRIRSSSIVRTKLNETGIKIIGEDLCEARGGRLVFLNCDSGTVEVYRPQPPRSFF